MTDRIHETITSLPYRETEEIIVKKKTSFATVIAAVLILVLTATALAATNETVNHWLYRWWPEAAEAFMPVNLSCEDQGIRMEMISAVTDGQEIFLCFSMEDLEENRLNGHANATVRLTYEETCLERMNDHTVKEYKEEKEY